MIRGPDQVGSREGGKKKYYRFTKMTADSLILILVLWSLHSPPRLQTISIIIKKKKEQVYQCYGEKSSMEEELEMGKICSCIDWSGRASKS